METAAVYIFPMRKREFQWEVIRLRARGEYLGVVIAPDEERARSKRLSRRLELPKSSSKSGS